MAERLIVVTLPAAQAPRIAAICERAGALDIHVYAAGGDEERRVMHVIATGEARQKALDALQSALDGLTDWRIVVLPVEATIPIPEPAPDADGNDRAKAERETREELYRDVERGARPDRAFAVFAVLSALTAAVGMLEDQAAVVIGAMVIAPLLGPNLAFALGAALGDRALMGAAMRTNALGLALTFSSGLVIGALFDIDLGSGELLSRAEAGFGGVIVALASGAAATLSLTTGAASALVGVMVAVALMPPAVATGIFLGDGRPDLAAGAALVLAVNVACVNLAAQATLALGGVSPRTWLEKKAARKATRVNAAVWLILLAGLAALLALRAGLF